MYCALLGPPIFFLTSDKAILNVMAFSQDLSSLIPKLSHSKLELPDQMWLPIAAGDSAETFAHAFRSTDFKRVIYLFRNKFYFHHVFCYYYILPQLLSRGDSWRLNQEEAEICVHVVFDFRALASNHLLSFGITLRRQRRSERTIWNVHEKDLGWTTTATFLSCR